MNYRRYPPRPDGAIIVLAVIAVLLVIVVVLRIY